MWGELGQEVKQGGVPWPTPSSPQSRHMLIRNMETIPTLSHPILLEPQGGAVVLGARSCMVGIAQLLVGTWATPGQV